MLHQLVKYDEHFYDVFCEVLLRVTLKMFHLMVFNLFDYVGQNICLMAYQDCCLNI